MASARNIWDTLSRVDVSQHIERKGGLSYLSWAWAWGTTMEFYPEAQYEFETFPNPSGVGPDLDVMVYPDESCSVHCTVSIDGVSRMMWLPVMDFRNASIKSPSSRQISDASMRCLVKCLAMHGLGHYIYAGEDTPAGSDDGEPSEEETPEEEPKKKTKKKAAAKQPNGEATEATGTKIAYEVFAKDCKTMSELQSWWKANRDELVKLEKTDQGRYKEVVSVFSTRKKELIKEEGTDGELSI